MKSINIFVCILLLFISLDCSSQKEGKTIQNKGSQTAMMKRKSHPNNPYYSRTDTTSLRNIPHSEWKKILKPAVYFTAFEKGTDARFKGYWNFKGKGTYYCAVCGNKLFRSTAKFASSCGWPSFFDPEKGAVEYNHDNSFGMHRIEVICARCGAHLGHVFDDGPEPTGLRYCMDSSVLDFVQDSTKKTQNVLGQTQNIDNPLTYNQILEKSNKK